MPGQVTLMTWITCHNYQDGPLGHSGVQELKTFEYKARVCLLKHPISTARMSFSSDTLHFVGSCLSGNPSMSCIFSPFHSVSSVSLEVCVLDDLPHNVLLLSHENCQILATIQMAVSLSRCEWRTSNDLIMLFWFLLTAREFLLCRSSSISAGLNSGS